MPGSWDGGDATVNDRNTAPALQKREVMPGADKAHAACAHKVW